MKRYLDEISVSEIDDMRDWTKAQKLAFGGSTKAYVSNMEKLKELVNRKSAAKSLNSDPYDYPDDPTLNDMRYELNELWRQHEGLQEFVNEMNHKSGLAEAENMWETINRSDDRSIEAQRLVKEQNAQIARLSDIVREQNEMIKTFENHMKGFIEASNERLAAMEQQISRGLNSTYGKF